MADVTKAAQPVGCARVLASLKACATSNYFWACLVYLIYTMQVISIDYCSVAIGKSRTVTLNSTAYDSNGDPYYYDSIYTAPSPLCDTTGYTTINRQWVAAGCTHLISAVLYTAAWWPFFADARRRANPLFVAAVMLPEVLNIVEACLYLFTATLYAPISIDEECAASYWCARYMGLHRLETAAASISLIAAFLWLWQWWATHVRAPYRGLSPFDVDVYSQILLIAPSIIYVVYNATVLHYPPDYEDDFLYVKADVVFFVGSVLYMLGALRDLDFFFWLPWPGCGQVLEAAPGAAPSAAAGDAETKNALAAGAGADAGDIKDESKVTLRVVPGVKM
jgi:hypothetical protein